MAATKMSYYAALANLKEEDNVAVRDKEVSKKATAERKESGKEAETSARKTYFNRRGPSGILSPLVWIDLEMTGLDVERDSIIEIACLITDGDLEKVIEGPDIAIHYGDDVLNNMNEWSQKHHDESGLTERARKSTISLEQAETQVLEFVESHSTMPAQLAGNSVYVDLAFLKRYMPRLAQHLHYRVVDVTTVVELARRWFPLDHKRAPKKKGKHTALSDIKESLAELRYYQTAIFKPPRNNVPLL